jgi:hypothetical protein
MLIRQKRPYETPAYRPLDGSLLDKPAGSGQPANDRGGGYSLLAGCIVSGITAPRLDKFRLDLVDVDGVILSAGPPGVTSSLTGEDTGVAI